MSAIRNIAENASMLGAISRRGVQLKQLLDASSVLEGELSDWFSVEFATAARANGSRFRLKPTQRLIDLLAATETLCIDDVVV